MDVSYKWVVEISKYTTFSDAFHQIKQPSMDILTGNNMGVSINTNKIENTNKFVIFSEKNISISR